MANIACLDCDWRALALWAQNSLSAFFSKAGAWIQSGLAAAFNPESALGVEPLVTINAIGVGIMLFSLEHGLTRPSKQPTSLFERKQRNYLIVALDLMVFAGFFHFASVGLVLVGRAGCDEVCPVNQVLPWATTLTMFGAMIMAGGVIRAWWGLSNLRLSGPPLSADETPTLRG